MAEPAIIIGLTAVVMAAGADGPSVLLAQTGADSVPGLPFGSFDPEGHRTFEIALRDFVTAQTGFALGYVEQLYTFGDRGREAPRADMGTGAATRVVSVGYLALTPPLPERGAHTGTWAGWYRFFPWEDRRGAEGLTACDVLVGRLDTWATSTARRARVAAAFGTDGKPWQDAAVLERYEVLYEAGLVTEAVRDRGGDEAATSAGGQPLASDHRRILATGMGRLRAKLRYRPVLFDLAPDIFTLSQLQDLVEAICGVRLHKQNFRRIVETSGLVTPTGGMLAETGGRPAKLFARAGGTGLTTGLTLPLARR